MKKGWMGIFVLFLLLGGLSGLRGQDPTSTPFKQPPDYIPNPFVVSALPPLPVHLGLPGDTLTKPAGLLKPPPEALERSASITPDWQFITITERFYGQITRVPCTASMTWYFQARMTRSRILRFQEVMHGTAAPEEKSPTDRRGSQSLELVGVDVGDLGRVSLRVRGNVNVSGKMVFQDQQLRHSTINEAQNTHIEFDQKQNLNIEGKIGERVSVLMDQDSERDFDWENNIRIAYQGTEDEILQRVEAGNISLSLPATQYVTFSGSNKGLFGLKAISKLGPVDITTIASIEQTKKEKQKFEGASESQTQSIKDFNYRRNQYFFIHEWFRDGITNFPPQSGTATISIPPFYPLSDQGLHYVGNVVVRDFELYKSVSSAEPGAYDGVAYVKPDSIGAYPNQAEPRIYKRLERDIDYTIDNDLGYVRLRSPAQNEVIGCTYRLVNSTSGDTVYTLGHGITASDSTLVLKLLKTSLSKPGHPVWDLMFKNVYFLGTTSINPEGFAVRILNDLRSPPDERNPQGVTYITLFGLDRKNLNNELKPDERIDFTNSNLVNLATGELLLPALLPFVHGDSLDGGNPVPELSGQMGAGIMYTGTIDNDIRKDSRYLIEVDYTNQSSTISLGFMVVEGSEEVFLNGEKLTRGIDYQIDYFGGNLVLLKEGATGPNANLDVLYEKHELVSFDKKTIIGSRAQMNFGERSFLGATALYFNQSVINEKIELGYEPTRNFIWDLNGRFERDLDAVTRFLDRLPMLETEKATSFSIEGEFAQALPNPNPINNPATGDPHGVAFIDDFEGAKRTSNPPILRRFWKASSAPLSAGLALPQRHRARLFWYNPYTPVLTKSIWPDQSTSIRAQNETTNILVLHFTRQNYQSGIPGDSLWAGIISPFYSGDYDQTRSKFFEIWVRGTRGRLVIDLGRISEDWDGDGQLDTEDIPEAGFTIGNGFLEDNEDVGLDGCPNDWEDGWGGCLGSGSLTFSELLAQGETELINPQADPGDPNGDNWSFNSSAAERHDKYAGINGTEGNRNEEGGLYPDTEDIDRSGFLDKFNDYFTKTLPLNDSTYLAAETKIDGTPTGWRLFRIPLSHFQHATPDGIIAWDDIRYLRLVMTGIDSQAVLQIAKIELVGNEWQELGVRSDTTGTYVPDDSVFAVTIINTEDNPDYQPPRGVKGEYDRINEIRSKEQALVLKFAVLPGKHEVAAEKTLIEMSGSRAQSMLSYDRLKMYIAGKNSDRTGTPVFADQSTMVEFFMRFGRGEDYYEVRQPVYEGWNEKVNSLSVDLKFLTSLKLDTAAISRAGPHDTLLVSNGRREYIFLDNEGVDTTGRYIIQGQPSLSRLQFIQVGIRNTSTGNISGEVWLNELRMSGVHKDKGVAMRIQTRLDLADIMSTSLMYSRKDADFHVLQERLGSNQSSESFRVNTTLQTHKFLPKALGLRLPVTTSFSKTLNTPKYHPGTDILVDLNAVPDSILTTDRSVNFSTSLSRAVKSERRLVKYTLDQLSTSFSAKKGISSNYQTRRQISENYSGKLSWAIPFGRDNFLTPFKWLSPVPWLGGKVGETHLYYTPSAFNTGIDFSEALTVNEPRVGKRNEVYNLGLNRAWKLDYKITESLKTNYSRSMVSDMDHYRGYAWMAVRDLDPGIVTKASENMNTSFAPALLSWLRPTFNYGAGYVWSKPLASNSEGADIGTNLRFSANTSLTLSSIVELFYKPTTRSTGPTRRRGQPSPAPETGIKTTEGRPILASLHTLAKKVNPINVTYNENLTRSSRAVFGSVPAGYKFGWRPQHGLEYDTVYVGTNTGSWNYKQDVALRSGVNLTPSISTSFAYAQNVSSTYGGSGVETKSMSRDFLAWGDRLEKGLPFTGWSVRWTGLHTLPYVKKFARSLSLEHAFSGKETRNWQLEGLGRTDLNFLALGDYIDTYSAYERSSKINAGFAPLLGLTMTLDKGISTNIRYNYTKSVDRDQSGFTMKIDKSVSSSANYSHRGGLTIPLVFFQDFNIQNTINFTFSFDVNSSETYRSNDGGKTLPKEPTFNDSWKTGLRISYSFTTRVTGGIVYEYREMDNNTTGKKIDRDFGFDVNIAISG